MSPRSCFGDNEAANSLTKEDFVSTGNQYIYMAYHWIKELTQFGYVDVQSKRTKLNLSDVFTKPVDSGVAGRLFTMAKLLGYDDFRNESQVA